MEIPCQIRLIHFDRQAGTIPETDLAHGYTALDAGFDLFAPQTLEPPDGRRILFAWMSRMDDVQECAFAKNEPRIHCLTLPRELRVRDGKLFQSPARRLYGLLGEGIPIRRSGDGNFSARPGSRAWHLLLEAENCPAGLEIGLGEAVLRWDSTRFVFTRCN